MTDQERINATLQRQIDAQNARIDNVLTKVDALIDELHDFKAEMRERDNQRAEDMRRLHDRQDALQAKTDAKFDALNKQIQDTWRQTMIGVGGMIVAMSALLLAALK